MTKTKEPGKAECPSCHNQARRAPCPVCNSNAPSAVVNEELALFLASKSSNKGKTIGENYIAIWDDTAVLDGQFSADELRQIASALDDAAGDTNI